MIVHIDVYIPIIEVEQPVEREVQAERNIHPGRITSLWGQEVHKGFDFQQVPIRQT